MAESKDRTIIDDSLSKLNANNTAKYGNKEDDHISRTYRDNPNHGDIWCVKNVEKYLKRFISNSHKSGNLTDLYKSRDYLNRMIEYNEQNPKQINEVIET